jgi:hypothetical protein
MAKSIKIWWNPGNGKTEQVDEAPTWKEANCLVKEYRMCYQGVVWAGSKR